MAPIDDPAPPAGVLPEGAGQPATGGDPPAARPATAAGVQAEVSTAPTSDGAPVSAELGLESGEEVADGTVGELLAATGDVACWRARRTDGSEATVHSIPPKAGTAARDHFLASATDLAARLRAAPIPGVLRVLEIDPVAGAYVGDVAPLGTMVDLPLLKWTADQQLEFMRHLCTCLQRMHEVGLVHGCLRPEAVLLDGDLRPVLADAQAIDVAGQCRAEPARADDFRGYSPPEVRAGEPPDARADIYAAGRLLHFMLLAAEPRELDEEIPRLDALRAAPPGLVRIVRRCTTRDPAQRYESAAAMLADLDRYAHDEPAGLKHPEIDDAARFAEAASSGGGRPAASLKPATAAAKREADKPLHTGLRRRRAPLGFLQWTRSRAIGFAVLGLGMIGLAIVIAYVRGADHVALKIAAMLGGAMLGLAAPGFGKSVGLSRLLIVVMSMAVVTQIDPTRIAARQPSKLPGGVRGGTVEERAEAVRRLKASGKTEIVRVDLAGANLAGFDLRGVVLDGSTLRGANCQRADFTGASLLNVDVGKTDFSGAKLGDVNPSFMPGWPTAKCDGNTGMPGGWSCKNEHPAAAKGGD